MRGANGVRGEVEVVLGGVPRRLCLTLGALAEMETGLGVSGLEALGVRMGGVSAGDLMVVLAALLRGGGEVEAAQNLAGLGVSVSEAAQGVVRAFEAGV